MIKYIVTAILRFITRRGRRILRKKLSCDFSKMIPGWKMKRQCGFYIQLPIIYVSMSIENGRI